mmetsp:Transcript_609/g.807  ORF Transcript_609/g.807 Transcript_609/m.807 type:complete len:542 (+) Transcript_609:55-1680(+)|eukprot:CAMPEP_0172498372 /NCGR_PEP_ID=MMETSP1066-20121228/113065_1 /TAXON_ID=671091 /ORGANISM="Coscinodiscus wailesii, Strain CCMP2513" /LENGTH=541 /DNA_ID=CAMNT_0013271633 /DNA_START=55 /DNA_END=1680 /DNA_ORIENTATION=-
MSSGQQQVPAPTATVGKKERKKDEATSKLNWVALFLGELRDGLTMINMQSAFLLASKNYTEKQAGVLFFTFGMSQFLFQTPAGYLMDYSDRKVMLLSLAGVSTTCLTIFTAMSAKEDGENLGLMILVKFVQGAVTALIPPGLNSITQGIVGAVGMTGQVSSNEMMNHLGTSIIVLIGSLIAFGLYPDIGYLFVISPIACFFMVFFLTRIKPEDIDHNAARGLTLEAQHDDGTVTMTSNSTSSGYKPPLSDTDNVKNTTKKPKIPVQTQPSFQFGFGNNTNTQDGNESTTPHADTPLQVLRDPTLITFTFICFLFHTANGCILPLVMQSLAIGGGRSGILLSGMCIILAQLLMVLSAKICGDYSGMYGRKPLFLVGLFIVSIRCAILTTLITIRDNTQNTIGLQAAILSTQILDGVGAGVFGTMYILVTSDISGGTGRFSLTLGITTAAMSIGGTVSGYLGEALAQDLGYKQAFIILGAMSLIPASLYLFCMPETLPTFNGANIDQMKHVASMASIREEPEHESHSGTNSSNQPNTSYTQIL